jgi:hypothetical protein
MIGLVTVAEFRRLPEKHGVYQELRNGEVFSVTRPKYKHYTIQRRIRRLLERLAPSDGLVDTEFSFRALAEHELRVADVVYLSAAREQSIDPEDKSPLRAGAQFANLFNVLNKGVPNLNVGSSSFGRVTGSQLQQQAGPRSIQMMLRLIFWGRSLKSVERPFPVAQSISAMGFFLGPTAWPFPFTAPRKKTRYFLLLDN